MQIKVVKLYKDGQFTQAFTFCGENKADGSPDIKYGSSLQNFLIDTGS